VIRLPRDRRLDEDRRPCRWEDEEEIAESAGKGAVEGGMEGSRRRLAEAGGAARTTMTT